MKFGVLGVGRFGKHYVRLLQEIEGAELKTVASRSQGSVDSIFSDPEINCVVIATPASTHFGLISRALAAGKHVLVEKPMVLSVAEAEAVRDLVRKSGLVFMVAHQYLYNDYIRYLHKELSAGQLGKIEKITARHLYPGPVREDVDVFWDAAPHEFAILDFLLGPREIKSATGEKSHTQVSAEVEFSDGVMLNLELSSVAPEKVRKIEFVGQKGKAFFDDLEPKSKLRFDLGGQDFTPEIAASEPLRNELEHFIDCVRNKKRPLTDVEHGLRVVKNLEAVYKKLK